MQSLRADAAPSIVRPAPVRLHGDPTPWRRGLSDGERRVLWLAIPTVVMAALYFLLPGWLQCWPPAAPPPAVVGAPQAGSPAATAPAVPAETPAQRAERKRLRREAQDAFEPLERVQKALHALHPEYWDPRGAAAADQLAQAGEQAYLAQKYADATRQYLAARTAYEALIRAGRQRRADAIVAARKAIDGADIEAAERSLTLARRIGDGADVRALAQRVKVLPTVLAHVDRGIAARTIEDLEMAHVAFTEALRLDPATTRARQALAEVDAARARQRFMSVMDRGFDALQASSYETARAAFEAASSYQPTVTAAALEEVRSTALVDELQGLQNQADALLRAEQFTAAEKLYRQALAKDASLAFAQRGAELARARHEAAEDLDDVLANPGRLSSDESLAAARRTLQRAQALQGVGPQLAQRVDRVEALLAQAGRPVNVELRSDNLTAVRVYRVGAVGRFASKTLSLRPGRYTLMGTRDGYRDVRIDVDVQPGMGPVDVRCREPI